MGGPAYSDFASRTCLGRPIGAAWPALLASDLGAGQFDGANLVDNFENLNPANTFFDKYYTLFSKIDTEPERFLEFERWWGGFFLMDRQEIKWIVENLFVGNKLSSGEAEWSERQAFDLRAIRTPIIVFASLGDNITPPQQAFNWVADIYPTTEDLKANGQVIVGLMHKSVGHLGIFVSGQVAKREHTQIVDVLDYIEHLPPGLYRMEIERRNGRQHALRRGPDRAARRGPAGPAEIREEGRGAVRGGQGRLRLPRLSLRDAGAPRACFCGHP